MPGMVHSAVGGIRKLHAKASPYILPLQFGLVVIAFIVRSGTDPTGAVLIEASWLVGLVAFVSGIVAAIATFRFGWLGQSIAALTIGVLGFVYFIGIGL
jgi:hypothetical protein